MPTKKPPSVRPFEVGDTARSRVHTYSIAFVCAQNLEYGKTDGHPETGTALRTRSGAAHRAHMSYTRITTIFANPRRYPHTRCMPRTFEATSDRCDRLKPFESEVLSLTGKVPLLFCVSRSWVHLIVRARPCSLARERTSRRATCPCGD